MMDMRISGGCGRFVGGGRGEAGGGKEEEERGRRKKKKGKIRSRGKEEEPQ